MIFDFFTEKRILGFYCITLLGLFCVYCYSVFFSDIDKKYFVENGHVYLMNVDGVYLHDKDCGRCSQNAHELLIPYFEKVDGEKKENSFSKEVR